MQVILGEIIIAGDSSINWLAKVTGGDKSSYHLINKKLFNKWANLSEFELPQGDNSNLMGAVILNII